jgi:hypothetical protein
MPGKMALVDFPRCHPEECVDGVCVAALAYPRKLMKQEQLGEIPMTDPSICKGCGDRARSRQSG